MSWWLLALAACVTPPAPLPDEAWGITGCAEILHGETCEIAATDAELVVWVDALPHEATLRVGDDVVPLEVGDSYRGATARVQVAPSDAALTIEVGETTPRAVTLALTASRPDDTVERLKELRATSPETALTQLNEALAVADTRARGDLLATKALWSMGEDREASELGFREAYAAHQAAGARNAAFRDAYIDAWLAYDAGLIRAYQQRLDVLPSHPIDLALRATRHTAYVTSRMRFADLRGALRHSDLSLQWTAAGRGDRARRGALSYRAVLFASLGRHQEAIQLQHEVLPTEPGCDRADGLTNLTWSFLLATEAAQDVSLPLGEDPIALLFEARDLYLEHACPRAELSTANVSVNLALAYAQASQWDEALEELSRFDPAELDVREEIVDWHALLSAEVQAAKGDASSAGAILDELARSAERRGAWDMAVRTHQLAAELAERTGDLPGAAQRLRRATDLVGRHARLMPSWMSRAGLLSTRHRIAVDHARVLRALGRDAEAIEMWRRYRAGFLEGLTTASLRAHPTQADDTLDQRIAQYEELAEALRQATRDARRGPRLERPAREAEAAKLRSQIRQLLDEANAGAPPSSTTARRTPGPGERFVGWIPIPHAPLGFVVTEDGVIIRQVRPWDGLEGAALAKAVLGPLMDDLRGAQKLVLLPVGSLQSADLHALEVQGESLMSLAPTVYGLDLPPRAPRRYGADAVVVSDPTRDLTAARLEGRNIASYLSDTGLEVQRLEGNAATSEAVLQALARAPQLLHYAGHGVWSEEHLRGSLRLAEDGELGLADLLTLPSAPRLALLNGCETARTHAGHIASLGLAQGLLTAGSEGVVATNRPVDDGLASAFAEQLYEAGWARQDMLGAWRNAFLAATAAATGDDLGTFRLLVP